MKSVLNIANTLRAIGCAVGIAITLGATTAPARADDTPDVKLFNQYSAALKGKKIAFVPMSYGMFLTDGWAYVMKKEAERLGMVFETKDPNWSSTAQSQAVQALI